MYKLLLPAILNWSNRCSLDLYFPEINSDILKYKMMYLKKNQTSVENAVCEQCYIFYLKLNS